MDTLLLPAALVGAALGAAGTWLWANARLATIRTQLDAETKQAGELRTKLDATEQARQRETTELGERLRVVGEQRERLQATLEAERAKAAESLQLVERMDARLKDTFAALSAQALQANNGAFLDLAKASMGQVQEAAKGELDARRQSIEQLVKPMYEGLRMVDERIQAFDKQRAENHGALQQQLRAVAEAQQLLTGETHQLVKALRAPQVRGQWGELQLRRVVEMAGMMEHCDFAEQESVQGEH
ncbi:MAG TPA: DNA recombination protein RmuC, partial [Gemmatimonadaceae bacterium]|nr:DNA recombination protein RmuC [Gemmatimonadaceae bacterium]